MAKTWNSFAFKASKVPQAQIIDVDAEPEEPAEPSVDAEPVELAWPPLKKAKTEVKQEEIGSISEGTGVDESTGGTIPAWMNEIESISGLTSVDESTERVLEILKNNVQHDKVLQAEPIQHSTEEELEFLNCIKSGKVPTRNCKIARLWDKSIKSDLLLARKYAKTPKKFHLQQAFKVEWAKGIYEEMVRSRKSEQSTDESDAVEGKYVNFAQLVQILGGGKMGFMAARNYLGEAQLAASKGQTHRGRPYLGYDAWQKMVQILHIAVTFKDTSSLKKTLVKEQHQKPSTAIEDADEANAVDDDVPATPKKGKASPPGKKKGKGKGKGKSGSNSPMAADGAKAAAAAIAWAEKMRKDLSNAMHSSADFIGIIVSQPEYAWANTPVTVGVLRSKRAELDQLKQSSSFWKEWSVQGFWPRWVKKHLSDGAIVAEVEKGKEAWTHAISALEAEMSSTKRMHLAKSSANKG